MSICAVHHGSYRYSLFHCVDYSVTSSFNSRGSSARTSSAWASCSSATASAKLISASFFTSGIFLVLFDGRMAIPLFEIWPLYKLSKSSFSSSSTSSCSKFSSGSFRNLKIALFSKSATVTLFSAISLNEIIVFLSLSSGPSYRAAQRSSPIDYWLLSFAHRNQLMIFP